MVSNTVGTRIDDQLRQQEIQEGLEKIQISTGRIDEAGMSPKDRLEAELQS